ncbi:MAG: hypothetical protein WCJ30_13785 [Deltaproteobacteria bacterium]
MNHRSAAARAAIAAVCALGAFAPSARAQGAPSLAMEPHRAARVEAACTDVVRPDWQHFVLGGTMAALGAVGYLPNLIEAPTARPAISQLSAGLGLGMFAGGLILILRPYGAGVVRLVDTCERLLGPRRGSATLQRDAERYLNLVSTAQAGWALRTGLVAAGVTVLGVGLSVLIAPVDHDRFFWSGVFLSIPLAIWLDLLAPPPPVSAALRFRHLPTVRAIAPMPLDHGAGVSFGGTF